MNTCSIPACLEAVGLPTTPLSLRPPTSCFSLVTLTSNWLNCSCISFSLATRFSRCSKIAPPRFRFFGLLVGCEWRERPALDMATLSCLSCEPPMLTPKFQVVEWKKPRSTTPCSPPLPPFAGDAQIVTKFSPNMSTFVLKLLPGSSIGGF